MAKISPVSIKYTIYAKFEAQGAVEKPDVIGALFGQTEGLLGNDLEMRELQKEGKIGRVEVELNTEDGKTTGEIEIPTALDKTETTLIAAALETIERIGPTDAKIIIEKIDDVRGSKRDYIMERAKKLLEGIEGSTPDTREMQESIKTSVREGKIQEYGVEKLPSGDISGRELIVVEGRADVVNLLRCGVNNVIGMNGTNLPSAIKELGLDKEITLFIDGDRGGKLIAKNVIDNARVDYVAVAPDGKEVEELAAKEVLIALRRKIPVSEFTQILNRERRDYGNGYGRRDFTRRDNRDYRRDNWHRESVEKAEPAENAKPIKQLNEEDIEKFRTVMDEIDGSKKAVLFNENIEEVKRISSTALGRSLRENIYAVVMDGIVTSGVIRACEESGVKHLGARNFGSIDETNVNLISL